MPSRTKIIVGLIALILLTGGGYWYWNTMHTTGAGKVQYPLLGIWESSDGEELWLEREGDNLGDNPDIEGLLVSASTTSGVLDINSATDKSYYCYKDSAGALSWSVFGARLVLSCGDRVSHTLNIKRTGNDSVLVDTTNKKVFTRQKALSFDYREGGVSKRLTLYEIPGGVCHACGGYLWGVFEQSSQGGEFQAVAVTASTESLGSYGRVALASKVANNMNEWNATSSYLLETIGKAKETILFPIESMRQGYVSSSGWLLEYSNNALAYRGFFRLNDDNSGTCREELTKRDPETTEEPCVSSEGTISFEKTSTSNSEYNDIVVKRVGTKYVYARDEVVPVNETDRYVYDVDSGEYALTRDRNSASQSSATNALKYLLYTNKEYGFEFNYPATLITLSQLGRESTCEVAKDSEYPCTIISASGSHVSVAIISHALNEKAIWDDTAIRESYSGEGSNKSLLVGGKSGYEYDFVTGLGYSIHGVQIPLDSTHFLELQENAKTPAMTDGEWARIISTFIYKK